MDEKRELRTLFVGGELFDWNIDATEIVKASQSCGALKDRRAIPANIQHHFLMCFAAFLEWPEGKPLTLKIINEAIEKGIIE